MKIVPSRRCAGKAPKEWIVDIQGCLDETENKVTQPSSTQKIISSTSFVSTEIIEEKTTRKTTRGLPTIQASKVSETESSSHSTSSSTFSTASVITLTEQNKIMRNLPQLP